MKKLVVFMFALVAVVLGCAPLKITRFQFTTPRVVLHIYGDPAQAAESMKLEGLKGPKQLKPGEGGGGEFVLEGIGRMRTCRLDVTVNKDSIEVLGTRIDSREGTRNVTITKQGEVVPDAFLPFESHYPF